MFRHCIDYENIIIVFKDEAELYGCTHCGLSMAHSLIFVQMTPIYIWFRALGVVMYISATDDQAVK